MHTFFTPEQTAKDGIIPGTSGYDIHFQIAEGEHEKARELREVTVAYIQNKLSSDLEVHMTDNKQFDSPVGPWRKAMWQIQLEKMIQFSDKLVAAQNNLASMQLQIEERNRQQQVHVN